MKRFVRKNVARFARKVVKWYILWNLQTRWRTTILTELPSRNPLERKCIILSGKKGRAAEQMEKRVNVTIAWVLLILLLHNDNQGNYNWGNLIIHLGTFNYKVGPLKAAVTTAEEKIRRYSNSFSVAIAVYGVVVTRL